MVHIDWLITGSKARIWTSNSINACQTALQWENMTYHNKGGLTTQHKSTKLFSSSRVDWTLTRCSFLLINSKLHQQSVVTLSAMLSHKQPETHFFFLSCPNFHRSTTWIMGCDVEVLQRADRPTAKRVSLASFCLCNDQPKRGEQTQTAVSEPSHVRY